MAVIRDRAGKYVQFGGDLPPLFFDLSEDPDELVDLVSVPDRSGQVLDYAQRLLRLRIEHTDARTGQPPRHAVRSTSRRIHPDPDATLHRPDRRDHRPVGPSGTRFQGDR